MKAKTATEENVYFVYDAIEDSVIRKFLDAQRKRTRHTYSTYFRRLAEFTNETGQEMLDNVDEWLHKIFTFQEWLKDKGYSDYYVESATGCIRGFFSFYRKPLILTSLERRKLRRRIRSTRDYELNTDNIHNMYLSATSAKSRFIVAVSKSIGQRSIDFASITFGMLRNLDLDDEVPLYFPIETVKEGIRAECFLDKDAIESISDFLAVNTDKPDNAKVYSDPNNLSPLIRRLARKAKISIPNGFNLRYHAFRKYLFDNLNQVMSLEKAKMIIGKATTEQAYLSPNTLRESYALVMPKTLFSGNGVKKEVKDLKLENEALKAQIAQLKEANRKLLEGEKEALSDFDARLKIQEFETQQIRKKGECAD